MTFGDSCSVRSVQIPNDASGVVRIPAYALYHLCDDAGGQCRFWRLDLSVDLKVK